MTHTYNITGMTCESCAAKIKSTLEQDVNIEKAEVSKDTGKAIVTMKKHLTGNDLQRILDPLKKYRITEDDVSMEQVHYPENERSMFETYKPLLIIFIFITGLSGYSAYANGTFDYHVFMRNFMAGFFLTFSFFKLLDLKGFAESYSTYDLLAKKIPAYGYIYPFIELLIGIAYLTNFMPAATNMATIIVMGFSSIGVIRSVLDKKKIRCACLGAVFNLPMSTITIIEDLLMVAMAVMSLI